MMMMMMAIPGCSSPSANCLLPASSGMLYVSCGVASCIETPSTQRNFPNRTTDSKKTKTQTQIYRPKNNHRSSSPPRTFEKNTQIRGEQQEAWDLTTSLLLIFPNRRRRHMNESENGTREGRSCFAFKPVFSLFFPLSTSSVTEFKESEKNVRQAPSPLSPKEEKKTCSQLMLYSCSL